MAKVLPTLTAARLRRTPPSTKGQRTCLRRGGALLRMWQWPRVIMMMMIIIKNHSNKLLSTLKELSHYPLGVTIW